MRIMRHTDEQIEEAARRAEVFDPEGATVEDTTDLRAIAEAAEAVRTGEARLREAVETARAHGRSWNQIAIPLSVSRQAARQRFVSSEPSSRTLPGSTRSIRRESSTNPSRHSFRQDEVFPLILRVLRETHGGDGGFVTRGQLLRALLEDDEALRYVARAAAIQDRPAETVAGNMIDWFSQRITVGESSFGGLVERTKIDNRWAYRPTGA